MSLATAAMSMPMPANIGDVMPMLMKAVRKACKIFKIAKSTNLKHKFKIKENKNKNKITTVFCQLSLGNSNLRELEAPYNFKLSQKKFRFRLDASQRTLGRILRSSVVL